MKLMNAKVRFRAVIKNWPKTTLTSAVYLTILLILFVMKQNFALFLIWVQLPVYFFHEFEEYILPGGFLAFFNTKILGSKNPEFPLDEKRSFWINVPIIFIAFPISAILATQFSLSFGIWTVYFSVFNSFSHVVMFFKHRYNPGFWVSLLINIPVGVFTIWYFASHQLIPVSAHIVGLLIGLAVQGGLIYATANVVIGLLGSKVLGKSTSLYMLYLAEHYTCK